MTHTATPANSPPADWLATGIAHQRRGELDRAEQSYRTLLRVDPQHALARTHLAGILLATNRPGDAEALYRELIAERPDRLACMLHLATSLQLQQRFADACEVLLRLREKQPSELGRDQRIEIEKRLGELWFHQRDYSRAEPALKLVVQQTPDDAFAWELLGCVQAAIHRCSGARASFERAVAIDPSRHTARLRLAEALYQQQDDAEAEAQLRTLLTENPENAGAWLLLGSISYRRERPADAVQCFHKATMLQPHKASHWSNWGAALQLQGDLRSALKTHDQAVALDARDSSAWTNRAAVLQDRRRFDEAERCYEQIISIKPDDTASRHNRSLLWLLQGDVERGLVEHEFRSSRVELLNFGRLRHEWTGEPLAAERLVVLAEQGLGDEVMFAQYFATVQARVDHVSVECDARLIPLFERSFPGIEFISRTTPRDAATSDRQVALASLPLVLGDDLRGAKGSAAYLRADPALRKMWQERFDRLPAKRRVGISWAGGGTPLTRRKRTIPLSLWSEVLNTRDVAFVNLQYGAHRDEGSGLYYWPDADPTHDIDGFAALVSELDLVITIDNSTVHLAGALGTPTLVLLPNVSDWRWGLTGDRTPWYGTVELVRQTEANDWTAPLLVAVSRLHSV